MMEVYCAQCGFIKYDIADEIMTPDGRVYIECPCCGDMILLTVA